VLGRNTLVILIPHPLQMDIPRFFFTQTELVKILSNIFEFFLLSSLLTFVSKPCVLSLQVYTFPLFLVFQPLRAWP